MQVGYGNVCMIMQHCCTGQPADLVATEAAGVCLLQDMILHQAHICSAQLLDCRRGVSVCIKNRLACTGALCTLLLVRETASQLSVPGTMSRLHTMHNPACMINGTIYTT